MEPAQEVDIRADDLVSDVKPALDVKDTVDADDPVSDVKPALEVKDFFYEDDPVSDVSLEIEGRRVHFNRALLIMASPVFARMFTSDFKEREVRTIPLPEKKLEEFLPFLKQLHPVFSWMPLSDEHLEPALKLADEYDVAHIRKKCSQFIRAQLECALSMDQAMRYLWLSDSFHLPELQPVLLGLSAEHRAEALEGSAYFPRLQGDTQLRLIKRRCHLLQDKEENRKRLLMVAGRVIRKMKPVVDKLPSIVESLPEECPSLYCAPCEKIDDKCTGPWDCEFVDTTSWCTRCVQHTSDLQHSFCQGCVIPKLVVLVRNLNHLVKPATGAPWFQRRNIDNMLLKFD